MLRTLSRFGLVITATGTAMAMTVAALAYPVGWLSQVGSGRPAPIDLASLEMRSYVYAADGSPLAVLHGEFNRQPITLAEVPPHVVAAILAVEDSGFWTHDGVDGRALLRAFSVNVGEGDVSQGGSTITQQLVKLSVLNPEQTIDRKVQEIVLARRLEREMSKEDILTQYLNTVYFGNHAYGIQAAAETYFGVPAANLDVAQAALLAGIIRNPSLYNPVRFPERATERRATALDRMQEEGIITGEEATYFNALPIPTAIQQPLPQPNDYFVEEVKQQLLDDPTFGLGMTPEERESALFTGGLKIYTTFDPRAQQLALQARDNRLGAGGMFDTGIVDPATGANVMASASIVSVEPTTGAIRAMVGGPGFDQHRFNMATQSSPPRQVGSAFKTYVLASLMEQGYSPQDMVNGTAPCTFVMPPDAPEDVYTVGGSGTSWATITEQTSRSVNCAYVRLGQIAGLNNVIDMAQRLGLSYPFTEVPSLPLGTQGAQGVEMAGAYAAFVNDGVFNRPYYIDRVEDAQGRVLWEHQPAPTQALSVQAARLVTEVLAANVRSGTARAAQLPDGRPASGKTGTTQDNADVWFIGSTAQLTTAVWIGGMGSTVPLEVNGRELFGGGPPSEIWGEYMGWWHEGMPMVDFNPPGPTRAPTILNAPVAFDPSGQFQQLPPENQPPEDPGRGGGGGGGGGGGQPPNPTLPTFPVQQTTTTRPPQNTTLPPIPGPDPPRPDG